MKIKAGYTAFENEPLKTAFGFKGNALTYLTQSAVYLGDGERFGVGVGVQSVLWSDAVVFSTFGEDRGNEFMYSVTKRAVETLIEKEFETDEGKLWFLRNHGWKMDDVYAQLYSRIYKRHGSY